MTLKLLPSLTMKFEENVVLPLSNYSAPAPPDKIKNYIIKMAVIRQRNIKDMKDNKNMKGAQTKIVFFACENQIDNLSLIFNC